MRHRSWCKSDLLFLSHPKLQENTYHQQVNFFVEEHSDHLTNCHIVSLVTTAFHVWLAQMYTRHSVAVYIAGTRFDALHSWRVVSALTSLGDVTIRFWRHFPFYSESEVNNTLSAVLADPLPSHLTCLLTGRGRFSYTLLEHIHFYTALSSSSPTGRVDLSDIKRLTYDWANNIVQQCVQELRTLVRTPNSGFNETLLADHFRGILSGSAYRPSTRGGVFPVDTPPAFHNVFMKKSEMEQPQFELPAYAQIEPILRLALEEYFAKDPKPLLQSFISWIASAATHQAAASSLDLLLAVLFRRLSHTWFFLRSNHVCVHISS